MKTAFRPGQLVQSLGPWHGTGKVLGLSVDYRSASVLWPDGEVRVYPVTHLKLSAEDFASMDEELEAMIGVEISHALDTPEAREHALQYLIERGSDDSGFQIQSFLAKHTGRSYGEIREYLVRQKRKVPGGSSGNAA